MPNGESKLIPKKNQRNYILQVHTRHKNRTQPKTVWRDTKNLSSSEISRHYFRLTTQFQRTHRGHHGPLQYQVPPSKATNQQKNGGLAKPPQAKFINNTSDQFLNTALFRLLPLRTISSAKFGGSKTNSFVLPFVYENTSALNRCMTPLAFHV